MSETSPAEVVSDGFTDELSKLGFDQLLERFAVLGIGKVAAPVPWAEGVKGLWQGVKASPLGRLGSKALGWPLTAGFVGLSGVEGLRSLSRKGLQGHAQKMGL